MSDEKVLAWHFLGKDGKLSSPVNGYSYVYRGLELVHHGPIVICNSGLHASERAIDALIYAPGFVVTKVECSGDVVKCKDKIVCRRRKVIEGPVVASAVLVEFARWCADRAKKHADSANSYAYNAVAVEAANASTISAVAAAESAARAANNAARASAAYASYAAANQAAHAARSAHAAAQAATTATTAATAARSACANESSSYIHAFESEVEIQDKKLTEMLNYLLTTSEKALYT